MSIDFYHLVFYIKECSPANYGKLRRAGSGNLLLIVPSEHADYSSYILSLFEQYCVKRYILHDIVYYKLCVYSCSSGYGV